MKCELDGAQICFYSSVEFALCIAIPGKAKIAETL
jgi:hypothetical protein